METWGPGGGVKCFKEDYSRVATTIIEIKIVLRRNPNYHDIFNTSTEKYFVKGQFKEGKGVET
jgi:hypothetical protein